MLVLRPEHMRAFERAAEERFEQALVTHLAGFLPPRGVTVDLVDLAEQVQRGVALCPRFHLERQFDIARLFEIVCGSLGGFRSESLPIDALNILYTYRLDPALKLDRLQAWAEKPSGKLV